MSDNRLIPELDNYINHLFNTNNLVACDLVNRARVAIAATKRHESDLAAKQVELDECIDAMREFVDRCEKGEVRSNYTYNKFKQIINKLEGK